MNQPATAPSSSAVSAAELQHMLDGGLEPRMLDVRTGVEYESVHIPGSYNVPLDALDRNLVELSKGDHPVVVICQSGGRAGQACQRLTSSGRSSIILLEGGIQAWRDAGGQVITGTSNKWALDRQVRLVAGALVALFVLASLAVPALKWLAAAVGVGLFYSAVSNTCMMATLLAKLPYNQTGNVSEADIAEAVAEVSKP